MPDVTIEDKAGFAAHAAPGEDDDDTLKVRGIALGEGLATGTSGDDEHDGPSYYSAEVLEEAADDLVGKKIVDDSNHDDLESKRPPNDAIVGEVTAARHEPGVGLAYEGEIHREPEKSLVEAGLVDVSPALFHGGAEYDPEVGGRPIESIGWWRDLAVVDSGGSPAASIEAMRSPAGSGMVAEALAETFEDTDGAHAGARGDTNPASGEPSGRKMPDDPDPNDDPSVEELLSRIETLEAERDQLREEIDEDKDEKIEELRQRVDDLEGDKESLEGDLEPVEAAAAEAMSDSTGLSEDMVREKFSTGEMLDSLTDGDEPESVAEALSMTPDPQSGDPDPTDPDGGSLGDLSEQDEQQIEVLAADANHLDGVDDETAEAYREEAAEIAGVEDFADLEGEVV